MMPKKAWTSLLIGISLFLVSGTLAAQQITRIAVVDLGKISMSYSRDSSALRDFEAKKGQIQAELDKGMEEIKRLQSQRLEAERAQDRQTMLRLEGEIGKKAEYLREFLRVKQEELDREASRLHSSDQFVQAVYKQIQLIAEGEGYSIVLNLKSSDSVSSAVIWYSPMIDITDKVIQSLLGKAQ